MPSVANGLAYRRSALSVACELILDRPESRSTMPKCCESLVGENAARPFRRPAPIFARGQVRSLVRQLRAAAPIVEIGAGSLRNTLFLQQQGFRLTVVELPGIRQRFPKPYSAFERAGGHFVDTGSTAPASTTGRYADWGGPFDVAVATFVVETICCPDRRLALLQRCRRSLNPQGALIIAVRGEADVVTATASGVRCSDGFLTPQKTFIRSFNRHQLRSLLERAGFASVEFLHGPKTMEPEYLYALGRRD